MRTQSDNHHWYVLLDGKRHGPLSYADLTKAARDGVVTAETNIWRSGWKNWHAAKSVKGLVPERVEAPLAPDDTVWADDQVRAPKEAAFQARAPKEGAWQQPYTPQERRDRRPGEGTERPAAPRPDSPMPPRDRRPAPEAERRPDPSPRHESRRPAADPRADGIFADEWRTLAKQPPRAFEAPRTRGTELPARIAQKMQVRDSDADRRYRQSSGAFSKLIKRMAATVFVVLLAAGVVMLLQSGVLRTKMSGARAAAPGELPAAVAALPAVATLQRNDPDAYARFLKRYAAGATAARDDDEAMTRARNALRKSVKQLIAISSGDVLIDITEASLAYLQGLEAVNPESCVALSDESKGAQLTTNLARELPALFSREMSVLERVAATNGHTAVAAMSAAEARPYFDKVAAVLMRESVRADLQTRARLDPSEFQPYCALVIAFYQAVLDLPRDDKVNLLRNLYATAAVNADADLAQR